MNPEDARRLSPAEQHERRRQVIRAYKGKLNKRQLARDVGVSYFAACKIINRYNAVGLARWRQANVVAVLATNAY